MPTPRLPPYLISCLLWPWLALAEEPSVSPAAAIPAAVALPVAREVTDVEPAFVAAPKLTTDLLKLPLSATVSDAEFLNSAMVRTVQEAAIYAPNTFCAEASARRLSVPTVRGIGSSGFNW